MPVCVCVGAKSLFDSGGVSTPSIFSCQSPRSDAVPACSSSLDINAGDLD